MTTLPVMRTWVAGELVTAAYMNSNVRDAGTFLLGRPAANLRQSVAQSVASSVYVPILWDTEDLDRDGGHSTVTNTSRYTAQTPGYYWVAWTLPFVLNGTGGRGGRIRTNGTDTQANAVAAAFGPTSTTVTIAVAASGIQYLNGTTDYVELCAFQSSGVALNTYVQTDAVPRMSLLWVSS